MNLDKYILVSGASEPEIKKALQQFSNNYADSGVGNGIQLYSFKDDLFTINVSEGMDLEIFKYLVNYLNYPEGIEYNVDVKGFWTIGSNDKIKNNHLGQRVMFYISPKDTEYDNVFGIFKGGHKTIKFGFAFGEEYEIQENKELDYSEPQLSIGDLELVETINPDPSIKKSHGKGCLLMIPAILFVAAGVLFLI